VDVEVFGVVRREHLRGQLDRTQEVQVIEDIETWPGERLGHRPLLPRASSCLALRERADGLRAEPGEHGGQGGRGQATAAQECFGQDVAVVGGAGQVTGVQGWVG